MAKISFRSLMLQFSFVCKYWH